MPLNLAAHWFRGFSKDLWPEEFKYVAIFVEASFSCLGRVGCCL